jgi:hypothetical protein
MYFQQQQPIRKANIKAIHWKNRPIYKTLLQACQFRTLEQNGDKTTK